VLFSFYVSNFLSTCHNCST